MLKRCNGKSVDLAVRREQIVKFDFPQEKSRRHRKRENSRESMSETCKHIWVKNGTRRNRKSGMVQRWVCTKCGDRRKDYEHDPGATRLQALALLARRLSLDQAEYLTGLKSETIGDHLRLVVADPGRWEETRKDLSQLRINERDLDYLRSIVDFADCSNQRLQPCAPKRPADRAEMKKWIESVMGCEVVVGTSRQGVRVCRKKDFDDFIRRIRRLPIDSLATTKGLSPKELRVLHQLRSPSPGAKLLFTLQSPAIEVDPVARKPCKLTMKSLADDLKMDLYIFTGIAVGLVRRLRNWPIQTNR